MKKKILIIAIAFYIGSFAKAQITLDTIYSPGVELIKLDNSTYKYLRKDLPDSSFTLYNLNYSIYKTIHIPVTFPNNYPASDIGFITTTLFDCDSTNIEYLVRLYKNSIYSTKIYREDGTLLLSVDTACVFRFPTMFGTESTAPIVNTPNGTKMMLDSYYGSTLVYSLCGTLPTGMRKVGMLDNGGLSNPYPNPNNGSTRIDYTLPPGVNEGEIVFYNLQGMEVKSFKVDRTFNTLLISTKDIAAGTYYYQLQTAGGSSGGKRWWW